MLIMLLKNFEVNKMIIEMDLLATTAIGCAVALLGRFFINKVEVLKN